MIPLAKPLIPAQALREIAAILDSGMLVEGARCRAFASELAARAGSPHAVLVNSGTSALYLALRALGLGPGDSVLVPAYTFPATANSVAWAGAEPVFVDIDPNTYNMDAHTVEARLETMSPAARKRIKAVMPVQAFGNPVDIKPLMALARKQGWKVIEDAACGLGSTLNGKACGSHGDVGCFSFHPRKILTTGEGGALVTASAKLAAKLALLKNHGMTQGKGKGRMVFHEPGLNLRFTEVAAALGRAQLKAFDRTLRERRKLAGAYAAGLRQLGLPVQESVPGGDPNWQAMVVRLPLKTESQLDRVIAAMAVRGVQTNIGTYLVPSEPAFKKIKGVGTFPEAAALRRDGLALPLYEGLGEEGVATVLKALRASLPGASALPSGPMKPGTPRKSVVRP